MKQQYILLTIVMLFSIANFSTQAQEVMYLKQAYQRPLQEKVVNSKGEMIDYSMLLGTRDGTGKPWIVFSDRANNKTYKDADITSDPKISNIKFMEKFFVIDEDGKFVKIAQGTSETDGRIKVGNVYGWIPKANLLLWTHCIYNDEELTKKALLLNNIDMMEEEEKNNMQKFAKFYAHPDMHKKDFLNTSYFFKIYYIYKVLPDAVLIGKRKNFETSKSGDTILGWFSPKNITFWNSRIYIEHNSRGEAVEERAKYNDEYLFFDTADAAKVYRDGGMPSAKHIIMKMKDYEYDRRAGNVMRFPVLSENDGILKVVAIAEPEKNEEEIDALIALANEGCVDIAAVGNEVLYRNDLSLEALLDFMKRVRAAIPEHIPVGYVDAYYQFLDRPALIDACDVILVNFYPFWEGADNKYALSYFNRMMQLTQNVANGKKIIITETGWPSIGNNVEAAHPSKINAMKYFINVQEWCENNNIELFYFSSFDESWKVKHEGEVGAGWGIWDKNEKLKFSN